MKEGWTEVAGRKILITLRNSLKAHESRTLEMAEDIKSCLPIILVVICETLKLDAYHKATGRKPQILELGTFIC